jgi:threonylcarbamoyladenosine tRNA methylthiotransferase MtaB
MSKPEIKTFGCRLNFYESEVMRQHVDQASDENLIVVNTCAVTAEAEKQARQYIRKARRDNPDAEIVVTGCSAQIDPNTYAAMPEVNRVLGNQEKLEASYWRKGSNDPVAVNDIMVVEETAGHLIDGFVEHTRAFVQVQQGCDHRCTFCIIPYGRGNSRSVAMGEIVNQVRRLVENGVKEIVLTGVDLTSYGGDLPGVPRLGQLVRRLLAAVPELPRLRLSSIDSIEADDDLFRMLAEEERLMPHLHLSLQAGSDMILKRMKRRHLRRDSIEFCEKVRRMRPDVVFGADLIAGFPTETDAMFQDSLAIIDDCDLTYLHVFPYSEREGTPAAKMPSIPLSIRKERAKILRTRGEQKVRNFLSQQVGQSFSVLMEKDGRGRTEQFAPIRVVDQEPGSLLKVKATAVGENLTLEGMAA